MAYNQDNIKDEEKAENGHSYVGDAKGFESTDGVHSQAISEGVLHRG